MLHDWGVIAAAFGYIGLLFFVASYGDRLSPTQRGRASALIYPLSLAIYCTSLTFFGSVGSRVARSLAGEVAPRAAGARRGRGGKLEKNPLDCRFYRRTIRQEPG